MVGAALRGSGATSGEIDGHPRQNPAYSLRFCANLQHATKMSGPVAQLAEHRTFNPGVLGSSPSGLTTYMGPDVMSGPFLLPDLRPILTFVVICGRKVKIGQTRTRKELGGVLS